MDRNQGQPLHETNISTKQPQAQTNTWFSCAYGNQKRATGFKTPASKGSSTTVPLTAANSSSLSLQRPAGFSRRYRLTTSTQFGRVFAHSSRSSDRYFTVLSRANNLSTARLGLAVSRRVAKHAVERNRLKRLARETFRCEADLPPLDFVILANKAAPSADNPVLRESLERHLRHLAKRAS